MDSGRNNYDRDEYFIGDDGDAMVMIVMLNLAHREIL